MKLLSTPFDVIGSYFIQSRGSRSYFTTPGQQQLMSRHNEFLPPFFCKAQKIPSLQNHMLYNECIKFTSGSNKKDVTTTCNNRQTFTCDRIVELQLCSDSKIMQQLQRLLLAFTHEIQNQN